MKRMKHMLAAVLVIIMAVGCMSAGSRMELQASVARSGRYRGNEVEVQIYGMSSADKRSDFSTINCFNGKEYKKPAYQYIKITDEYGTWMGFEHQPCCKKGKKSMIAWSGGSGVGGGQTCWAIITKKTAKKIALKIYWQDNEDALRYGTKPECILKDTLKLIND